MWLVARALSAMDPYDELWSAAQEMEDDPTGRLLAFALPEGGRVVVVGATGGPLGLSLSRRGDLDVVRAQALRQRHEAQRDPRRDARQPARQRADRRAP